MTASGDTPGERPSLSTRPYPAVGQLWTDPLGQHYEIRGEISGGDWETRRYHETVTLAPELFRAAGWKLAYDPREYGGKMVWEW